MKLKILFIRAKNSKRIEKEGDFSTLEKVINSLNLFYPALYKAYAIYDGNKLLYSSGKIE